MQLWFSVVRFVLRVRSYSTWNCENAVHEPTSTAMSKTALTVHTAELFLLMKTEEKESLLPQGELEKLCRSWGPIYYSWGFTDIERHRTIITVLGGNPRLVGKAPRGSHRWVNF